MVNHNSTDNAISFNDPLVSNIIFDCIILSLTIVAIFETVILTLLILIHCQLRKAKEKVLFLLSLNMYMSTLVFALFLLDMMIPMIKGHLYPNTPDSIYNTTWCQIKAYLTVIALICGLYSYTIQALYRFCRIVFPTHPYFHENIYLYIFGILIQVVLSSLQSLPTLLMGHYQYQDYHCQIRLTNWQSVCLGAVLLWLLPISITIGIYMYTVSYIQKNSSKFTQGQRTRIQRDFIVIKRILIIIMFIVIFGLPTCFTAIVYYLFGFIGWWANHLSWLIFIVSFTSMSTIQTYYSPHLDILWKKKRNQIAPTTAIIRRSNRV